MLAAELLFFFFFNDTATTEIYTLSLHDALPISSLGSELTRFGTLLEMERIAAELEQSTARISDLIRAIKEYSDRKSTRLNSSHGYISYAVFCLKKKNREREDGYAVLPQAGC